ncbi:hypothetical protein BD410DRAFT_737718 [Rickenella mellea]|uniref:Tubulin-tyrosine ligase n=1 Tax=Rickenella mellea TaxID=50990 RepID=A0A4Y7QNF0_9AGAM|nr:hypothetical protein BD410DRAFT_737718 [Rickenella mellea]
MFEAFVSWPSAPLTDALVRGAMQKLEGDKSIFLSRLESWKGGDSHLLQWCTYDDIDHNLTLAHPSTVLASSYTIRKALIRKHFMHKCADQYLAKNKASPLKQALPMTMRLEISFADELDEMWYDELYDLGEEIEKNPGKWWILKPGMADRGMGIRLFNSKEALRDIFEAFEQDSDGSEDEQQSGTAVVASQLRFFVIQEYLMHPLLLNPSEGSGVVNWCRLREISATAQFHLRVYCVASGALAVYFSTRILALFSSEIYCSPTEGCDLRAHLTNTSLQQNPDPDQEYIRLLDELEGLHVISAAGESAAADVLTHADIAAIIEDISDALAEVFRAAVDAPVHFQLLPNAFELYGVDFLITHCQLSGTDVNNARRRFQVNLLEVNAEPAIELTGPRLHWILEEIFAGIRKTCIQPFFDRTAVQDEKGDAVKLRKCLELQVRGPA